jgi:ankyrin repeat protein
VCNDIAQLLLDHGTNPDGQDEDGWTSLHFASDCGHVKLAQLLLAHGANVNAQAMDLQTPLHKAISAEVVKVLLEHGADLHIRDEEGKTPFQIARERYFGKDDLQLLSEACQGRDVGCGECRVAV